MGRPSSLMRPLGGQQRTAWRALALPHPPRALPCLRPGRLPPPRVPLGIWRAARRLQPRHRHRHHRRPSRTRPPPPSDRKTSRPRAHRTARCDHVTVPRPSRGGGGAEAISASASRPGGPRVRWLPATAASPPPEAPVRPRTPQPGRWSLRRWRRGTVTARPQLLLRQALLHWSHQRRWTWGWAQTRRGLRPTTRATTGRWADSQSEGQAAEPAVCQWQGGRPCHRTRPKADYPGKTVGGVGGHCPEPPLGHPRKMGRLRRHAVREVRHATPAPHTLRTGPG